jgi:hypothetical protein
MPSRIDDLFARIDVLEREIESEFSGARERLRYRIEAGRVRFARDVHQAHRRIRQSVPRFLRESSIQSVLSAPFIYSLIVPVVILDVWVTLYQAICFRLYGIARVRRSAYIVIDRQHLAYLNAIEKLNCVFCAYANGTFAYVREIAGRTEQYWCPIRHAARVRGAHPHYRHFVDYGDAEAYRRRLLPLREELRDPGAADDRR